MARHKDPTCFSRIDLSLSQNNLTIFLLILIWQRTQLYPLHIEDEDVACERDRVEQDEESTDEIR